MSLTLTPTGLTVPHVDCFTCVICSKDMSCVSVSTNVVHQGQLMHCCGPKETSNRGLQPHNTALYRSVSNTTIERHRKQNLGLKGIDILHSKMSALETQCIIKSSPGLTTNSRLKSNLNNLSITVFSNRCVQSMQQDILQKKTRLKFP